MKRNVYLLIAFAIVTFVFGAAIADAQGPLPGGGKRAPGAPALGALAHLTYQGRLSNPSGAPINTTVSMVFKLYDRTNALLWASATRSVTPVNGLFTVYLGDGTDPNLSFDFLAQTAFIGVTVGGDAEMTPRQALNSLAGHSENGPGVVGGSYNGMGVVGSSQSSTGVYGVSNTGYGVVGGTGNAATAGVLASAAISNGIALEIPIGGIKATGAGGGSPTFAFIHVSSAANNLFSKTLIDNPLTNGNQSAMLFVTHVHNPIGVSNNVFNKAFGVVYYAGTNWAIYSEDGVNMPEGIAFNVLVINR